MRFLQNKRVVVAIGVICLLWACGTSIQETTVSHENVQYTLIIGAVKGKTSEFKDAVIKGLLDRYRETSAIEVMNISDVKQVEQKDYDVIVLVDACQAGMRLNGTVKNLMEHLDQKKTVAFITAGDPDWEYTYAGIDAVTAASEEGKEQEVIQEIAAKIDTVLGE